MCEGYGSCYVYLSVSVTALAATVVSQTTITVQMIIISLKCTHYKHTGIVQGNKHEITNNN